MKEKRKGLQKMAKISELEGLAGRIRELFEATGQSHSVSITRLVLMLAEVEVEREKAALVQSSAD